MTNMGSGQGDMTLYTRDYHSLQYTVGQRLKLKTALKGKGCLCQNKPMKITRPS